MGYAHLIEDWGQAMLVTELSDNDRTWVRERTEMLFGGDTVVSRDVVHAPAELPGFIAREGNERVGLATFHVNDDICELVTLDSLCQWCGVGTALLEAVESAARGANCRKIWVITTNDNIDALRFFQRRGFQISVVRPNGLDAIRKLKPGIPLTGHYGIPMRDEVELLKDVTDGAGWQVV
jgi:GNAT superfamily N-acetyltransferase